MRTVVTALTVALAFPLVAPARADLAPPAGQKRVGFVFKVEGLAAHPDRVLIAFPWSLSNGAPTYDFTEVRDGEHVSVGRRSPKVVLHAVDKAAWEAFARELDPGPDADRAKLEAFLATPAAMRCEGGPSPVFQLTTEDGRETVEEILVVSRLDATACVIAAKPEPAPPPKKSTGPCSGAPGSAGGLALAGLLLAWALTRRRGPAHR